jgi:hypothetical protein
MMSCLSTLAAVAGVVLLAPAIAQAQATTAPNGLPPGLGSGSAPGSAPQGRIDGGPAANKPAFKELRLTISQAR